MEKDTENEIDLKVIMSIIIKRSPLIGALAIIFGIAAFIISNYFLTPIYSANIKVYVNNQQGVSESSKVQQIDMNTSITLVNSYIAMLKTDKVLDEVAMNCGLNYSSAAIGSMISAQIVDEEAPMFMVVVRSAVPEHSQTIANTIADVAPAVIQEAVKGSSATVIDRAKLPSNPVFPDVKKYTLVGLLLGIAVGIAAVLIAEELDVRIKSSDYLSKNYEFPVLGIIPKISSAEEKR